MVCYLCNGINPMALWLNEVNIVLGLISQPYSVVCINKQKARLILCCIRFVTSTIRFNFHSRCSYYTLHIWWRHQMKTSSRLLALCEGNPPVTRGFPSHRPVTQSFDGFYLSTPEQTVHQTNERDAGDLRRHWAYNNVNVIVNKQPHRYSRKNVLYITWNLP